MEHLLGQLDSLDQARAGPLTSLLMEMVRDQAFEPSPLCIVPVSPAKETAFIRTDAVPRSKEGQKKAGKARAECYHLWVVGLRPVGTRYLLDSNGPQLL